MDFRAAQPALAAACSPSKRGRKPRRIGHNLLLRLQGRRGAFRSIEGAEGFAVMRSLISSAIKHGWDVMRSLNQFPNTLLDCFR